MTGAWNLYCILSGIVAVAGLWWMAKMKRRPQDTQPKKIVYAFFHPYASGGGGGERVLWKMIQYLQHLNLKKGHRRLRCRERRNESSTEVPEEIDDQVEIIIYTIDPPSTNEEELRMDAQRRFDVRIPKKVRLISLEKYKDYLSPSPFLSLVLESWGTMKLARMALGATERERNEDGTEFVFCDTTGCAFTFAVVRWICPFATTRIMAYVHYPTISTDMMAWEWQKHEGNPSFQRKLKAMVKLMYYYLFSLAYGFCGSMVDLAMVNSTWTYNHIHSLWKFGIGFIPQGKSRPIEIVYPPCRVPDVVSTSTATVNQERENTILSIGQFRPEKNHRLQIEALSILLKTYPNLREPSTTECLPKVRLLLIGSCRNDADRSRVTELRQFVEQLNLEDFVTFRINPPYSELQASMSKASIGIHTMRQEHFGIGIVEMMAGGLLTIAHNSGGPKSDIIIPGSTGFLATTADQYADAMYRALSMDPVQATGMRERAKASATRFSDAAFDERLERVLPLLYG